MQRNITSLLKKMHGNENLLAFQLSLVLWCIEKGISFKAFEHETFQLSMKFLGMCDEAQSFLLFADSVCITGKNPHVVLPDRKKLSKVYVPLLHSVVEDLVKKSVSQAEFASFTTDAYVVVIMFYSFNLTNFIFSWTSIRQRKFTSLTIHFINDWTLHSCTLGVLPTPESHTMQNIKHFLLNHLHNWLPAECVIVSGVTDNGANFMGMFYCISYLYCLLKLTKVHLRWCRGYCW
jgi:hypothetical protein